MFQEKIDREFATEIPAPPGIPESVPTTTIHQNRNLSARPDEVARLGAGLIICCLPFIALWLLARSAWNDLKAIGRGIRLFYRTVAEELSRAG